MRTRTRNSTTTWPAASEVYQNPIGTNVASPASMPSVNYTTFEQSITDTSGKDRANFCENKKWSLSLGLMSDQLWIAGLNRYHISKDGFRSRQVLEGVGASVGRGQPLSVPSDHPLWDENLGNASEYFRPSLNDGKLDTINFIRELKDVTRIAELWKRLPPLWRRLTGKSRRRRPWEEYVGDYVANAHLNWSFGIAPFLRDLAEIISKLKSTREKLKAMRNNSGKRIRKRYRLPVDLAISSHLELSGPYGWSVHVDRQAVTYPVYTCTIEYEYYVPNLDNLDSTLKSYLDAFGIGSFDPSVLWNAIPYSFLIDWIVDIGGWLRTLRVDALSSCVIVHKMSHSVHFRTRTSTTVDTLVTGSYRQQVYGEDYEYYKRIPCSLLGPLLPSSGSAGWREAFLALSLLITHSKPAPTLRRQKRIAYWNTKPNWDRFGPGALR